MFQVIHTTFIFHRISVNSESDQHVYLRFLIEGRREYSQPRVSNSGNEIAVVLPDPNEGKNRKKVGMDCRLISHFVSIIVDECLSLLVLKSEWKVKVLLSLSYNYIL